jgi:tRNA(fMet)-specific endonuclease VapC
VAYLIDTNALIRIAQKKTNFDANIRTKNPAELYICGVTIGEMVFGIENSSSSHKAQNKMFREAIMAMFQELYTDKSISYEYGKIKAELKSSNAYKPNNENDIWIAAHARAKNMILVTENIKDFSSISGLSIESWSSAPPIKLIT